MPTSHSQRDFALQVVQRLRDAGHEALWAGGCVRDELLGRVPQDYDVATSAHPDRVRELFGHNRTLALGAAFGVITILGRRRLQPIEVATFRCDGAYLDGRHPADVTFTSAEQDAQRRDFTMNGLFYDPLEDTLIDFVDGEQDLKQGLIRAIGDPAARFAEDKLRMLRAIRFATTFGFVVEEATLAAIQKMSTEVTSVSAERIGVELRKILQHPQRSRGAALLSESGLLAPLLPDLADWVGRSDGRWQDMLGTLARLESESISVALAALYYQTHRPPLVRQTGRNFRFTNKEIERAAWLVENFDKIKAADTCPWPRLQRLLAHRGATDLLTLATAIWGADQCGIRFCRDRLSQPTERWNPQPLLSGDDLIAHGLSPGKYFGELLEYVRDAQLEGQIEDAEQALSLVDPWLTEHRAAKKKRR